MTGTKRNLKNICPAQPLLQTQYWQPVPSPINFSTTRVFKIDSQFRSATEEGNNNTVKAPVDQLEKVLHAFEASAANFANIVIHEARVRQNYMKEIKKLSDEIRAAVRAQKISYLDGIKYAKELNENLDDILKLVGQRFANASEKGAELAHNARDSQLAASRKQSTDIGRLSAEAMKEKSPTFQELIERKVGQLFPKEKFEQLNFKQRTVVFNEIIAGAGRPRPMMTKVVLPSLRYGGRALLVISLGIAVHNIVVADNKIKQTIKEGTVLGGGIAGGAAGGAVAAILLGSNPVGWTVLVVGGGLVLVGGIVGSLLADKATEEFDQELDEVSRWMNALGN
jgi:hypothetical protein